MKLFICIMLIISQYTFVQSQILNWKDPIRISNNRQGKCLFPTICENSNGILYVVYSHFNNSENNHLYFTWFDGVEWKDVDTLYNEQSFDVYNKRMLCDDDGNLHLSVEIAYGAFGRVYYMKREGNVWGELIQISVDSLGNNWGHDMVIDDSGKIYIFFHTDDIYYRTIEDSILSDPINVSRIDDENFLALEPTVVINSQNTLYLSYKLKNEINNNSEIYYQEFNDERWSDPLNLSLIDDLSGYEPSITVDHYNNPHVVWRQKQTKLDTVLGEPKYVDYYVIFYSTRFKGQWSTPINISDISKSSSYVPNINIYKGKPIVFYHTIYESDIKESNYSYLLNDEWSVAPIDVNFTASLHFDFIIDGLDTLHFVTVSSPYNVTAYLEYIIGYSNPTSIQRLDIKFPDSSKLKMYPNPFNKRINIQLNLNSVENIDLQIFDINGRLVKTIISNHRLNPGTYLYYWDALNEEGREVSSGLYIIAFLQNSELIYSQKIILFK